MKLKILITFIATATLLSANTEYSQDYKQCMDNSGGVTSTMSMCNDNEIKRHDKLLNQNYKKAMAVLSEGAKAELKKIQREWMKYRDMKCGFEGSLTGGTMDIILGGGCILEMTATRAKELDTISILH